MFTTKSDNITKSDNTLFLSNITLDEIEVKLVTILINNQDQLLSGQYLYNLILDKFNYKSEAICPNFKIKYFIVLRSLDSNKEIKVIKQNNIYKVVYSNNLDNYTFDTCTKESKTFNREYHSIIYKPNEIAEYIDQYMPEKFTQSKTSLLHDRTKSEPSISYVDTENGNTIYHDLVKGGSCQIIKKLLDNKTMNIDITNNNDNTPLDYINDITVARLFIKDLYLQNKQLNEQLNEQNDILDEQFILLNKQSNLLSEQDKKLNIILQKVNKYDNYINYFQNINTLIAIYFIVIFLKYNFKIF